MCDGYVAKYLRKTVIEKSREIQQYFVRKLIADSFIYSRFHRKTSLDTISKQGGLRMFIGQLFRSLSWQQWEAFIVELLKHTIFLSSDYIQIHS